MLSKTLLDYHYKELPTLAHALAGILAKQIAEIDADVLQIDEANLPGSPDEWDWAVSAINVMLDAVPNTPAVHLCFGNYGGQTVQKGTWDKLISYINAYMPIISCLNLHIADIKNWNILKMLRRVLVWV
jgi:5-methyltetrahydropteroyltriglutamate--homocysteine methyltransferase